MPKLTRNFIETKILLPAPGKVDFYRDSELQGFGLQVRHSTMSFFVEKRVNGKNRRVVIGNYPLLSPESARNDALVILGDMAKGLDPARTRDIKNNVGPTLRQAFDEYMKSKEFRPLTRYNYPRLIKKNLGDWLDKPVTAISRGMVDQRFKELSRGSAIGTSGKGTANLTMKILRAVLNYAALAHEVEGQPLLLSNPVSRLTQAKAWHRLNPRQGVIPDHKLADWYKAVSALSNPTARDYYLVLLLTGLRRNEAPRLTWDDIDLGGKWLNVPSAIAKNGIEYRLPLSGFLQELFEERYSNRNGSKYVFPGYRGSGRYFGCYATLRKLRAESGCDFIIHDLRRTFLTMAERLNIPHYALKKLAGHSMRDDSS